MRMYLYPFGDPQDVIVLRDVSYGGVSAYQTLSPGEYTVAMRGFGAPGSSKPALTTSFMVTAGAAYTVAALGPDHRITTKVVEAPTAPATTSAAPTSTAPAAPTIVLVGGGDPTLTALGPDPGLRVAVLQDQMTAPAGKALVRVFQASLKEPQVTVSYGSDVLARHLDFGAATSYAAVSPGEQTVQFTSSGEHATMPVSLGADTIHTIFVLDDSSGLEVDPVTDAVGSQIMPKGGADTGFGGTAPHPPASPAPWLLMIAFGTVLTGVAFTGLRRTRRTAAG